MTANTKEIVADINSICKELIRFATHQSPGQSAYSVESEVFRRVLEIGRISIEAYLKTQAGYYHWSKAQHPKGFELPYNKESRGTYYSIFGEIEFERSYYCGQDTGFCPMDGAINLPPKGRSDFVRKMEEELAMDMSYEKASVFMPKYFPLASSTRAIKDEIETDSKDIEGYYLQSASPPVCEKATILAAEADNKGVPMVKKDRVEYSSCANPASGTPNSEPGKPKQEPKREGKKRDATVVSVSTHVPFIRTPEQVRDSLFRDRSDNDPVYSDPREKPVYKRVWATMEGKEKGLLQAQTWAQQADNDYVQWRQTITDGSDALQRRVDERFPEYERVLDVIHAVQYLWKASDAQFGKGTQESYAWVFDNCLRMLRGKTIDIIQELDGWIDEIDDKDVSKWKPIEISAGYFERNLDAMKYDEYLAKGWTIATGIIEGACRHVVKDRCEGSGMLWTKEGVEAFLRLRCVHQNGDWDVYHHFRMQQRQVNYYGITEQKINSNQLETSVYKFKANEPRDIAV